MVSYDFNHTIFFCLITICLKKMSYICKAKESFAVLQM